MSKIVAFLFPGQGRLPKELPPGGEANQDLFEAAEDQGLHLREWILAQDEAQLTRTEAAQPALFIDSLARMRVLRSAGLTPDFAAGHSLGEYGALVCAGVLRDTEALKIVIQRGRLMNGVTGTMAAIVKLDLSTVQGICSEAGPGVYVANHNGDGQVVVSGSGDAVARAMELATGLGGRGIPLKVSGPFHTPFMKPAQDALVKEIEQVTFSEPVCPVVSSVSGKVERTAADLKQLLLEQITAYVRWVDVVRSLEGQGVTHAVEIGSGNVLTGLGRRITDKILFLTNEEALDGGV